MAVTVAVSAVLHGAVVTTLSVVGPERMIRDSSRRQPIEISIEPAQTSQTPRSQTSTSRQTPIPTAAQISTHTPIKTPTTRTSRRATQVNRNGDRPTSSPPAAATQIVRAHSSATAPAALSEPRVPPTPSLLSMRSQKPVDTPTTIPTLDLAVPQIAAVTPQATPTDRRSPLELPPAPRIPGRRQSDDTDSPMVPDGNGTYRFDHSGFTAKVARDGRVTIRDKPSFQPYVKGPCVSCVKGDLAKYTEDPSSGFAVDLMALIPSVGIRFDLTDWVMRRSGDDPYSYAKAKFMDETREAREQMWHAESDERLREALQVLPEQLTKIWTHSTWTHEQRKRVLFDLWDECAETGSADRVRVGKQIRVTIVAFIRKRLPKGSRHAYTDKELAYLNEQRVSRSAFAPYPNTPPRQP